MTIRALLLFLPSLLLLQPYHAGAQEAGTGSEFEILTSPQMTGDPLFFVQADGEPTAKALLMRVPDTMPQLRSATQETNYEAGRDFTWEAGSREVRLVAGGRIPFVSQSALYPEPQTPHSYNGKRDSTKWMFFGEGRFFHDQQSEASYPTSESWKSPLPAAAPDAQLGMLRQHLKSGKPLKLVTLGDSISTGANASGAVSAPPQQPGYPDLVAQGLEERFKVKVGRKNLSVGGKDSVWGLTQIPAVLSESPDLVLLAFGMNDASARRTPDAFSNLMQQLADRLQTARPACTVIFISPMTANPEWNRSSPELYPAYAGKLAALTGPARALADVTPVWTSVAQRKTYLSLSGNGLNHPNDFGHRLYAAVVLEVIGGP